MCSAGGPVGEGQAVFTPNPRAELISAGGVEHVLVYGIFTGGMFAWGMWRREADSSHRLVLGPRYYYVPRAEGLASIGITDWTRVDLDVPTPADLPLEDFAMQNLGEFRPPPSTVCIVVPSGGFWYTLRTWLRLRLRRRTAERRLRLLPR